MATDNYQNLGPGALASSDSPFRLSRQDWLRLQLNVAQFDGPFPGDGDAVRIHRDAAALFAEWRDHWSPSLVQRASAVRAYGELVAANYPVILATLGNLTDDAACNRLLAALSVLHDQAAKEHAVEQELALGFATFADRGEALRQRVHAFVQQEAEAMPWMSPQGQPFEDNLRSVLLSFALMRGIWFALVSDLEQIVLDTRTRRRLAFPELLTLKLQQAITDWQSVAAEARDFSEHADQVFRAPPVQLRSRLCGQSLTVAAGIIGIVNDSDAALDSGWRIVALGDGGVLLVSRYGQCLEAVDPQNESELLAEDRVQLSLQPFSGEPKQAWSLQPAQDGCQRLVTRRDETNVAGRCLSLPVSEGQSLQDVRSSLSGSDLSEVYLLPPSGWTPARDSGDDDSRNDPSLPAGSHQLWRLGPLD